MGYLEPFEVRCSNPCERVLREESGDACKQCPYWEDANEVWAEAGLKKITD